MTEKAKYDLDELIKVRGMLNMMLMFRELIPAAMEQSPRVQEQLAKPGFSWANDYLTPPQDLLREKFSLMGKESIVDGIKALPDEAQRSALLSQLPDPNNIELPQVDMSKAPEFLAWAQMSMKSLDAIFTYGQPMPNLIRAAINGNDEALFKAISIDRAIQEIPEISARIRKAEAANQVEFIENFQKAIKGPSGHIKLDHPLLRYFLWVTKESGLLAMLGFEDRYQLFCVDLNVYPTDGKDPAGSLDTFIDRWEKSLST